MGIFLRNMRSIILSAMLLWTGITVAQNTCTVSDAGSYEVNGDYTWDGYTTNGDGNPVYEKSSGYPTLYMHANYSGEWVINEDEYSADPYSYSTYYTNSNYGGDSNTPPASGWSTENGYYPEPTASCGPQTNPPTPISMSSGCWASAAAGRSHTMAIKADGTLWAWGSAAIGRLGNGSTSGEELLPVQIGTDTDWVSVYVGNDHSIGMKANGTLWAWGSNYSGQLGLGHQNSVSVPTQIGSDTDWQAISLGNFHTMAIKTDGTLWTWGNNSKGQLGNGTVSISGHVLVPTQIGTDTDWAVVAAGYQHSQGIKTNGTLWGWGLENHGRLGNGNNVTGSSDTFQPTPAQIGIGTDWVTVSAGNNHSHALKTNGTLWAWGYGSSGRLGTGNTSNQATPIQIGTDTDWSIVRAANGFSNFLKTDGTRWACGLDSNGRLGNGSAGSVTVPTQIGTDTDWTGITEGVISSHGVGLKSDGSLWAWGGNNNGELGNGFTEDIHVPLTPGKVNIPEKGVTKTITTTSSGIDGDWVYYGDEDEGIYVFAINWAPDGSLSTANETARDMATVTLDVMSNYHSSTNGADASFIMGRYWNVDTQGNSFDEPVNIRYYYDLSEITDIETAADNYATANSSPKREVQWFKLNSEFNPNTHNSTTFNPDVYLTPSSMGGGSNCEKNYVQFDGLTSFSGGGAGVGVGAAFAGAPVLPVELLDFTGRLVNDEYVQLDWQTATEINNKGFDIERSKDGQNWERIGYVEGYGNTTDRQTYQFNDYKPFNGVNYYRLKQTDFDGSYEYTKTVTITIKQSNSLSIYPNPSRGGEIFLNFKDITTGILNIYNAQGKLVSRHFIENAQESYKVNLPSLGQGIFIAELSTGEEQLTSRFIIQE